MSGYFPDHTRALLTMLHTIAGEQGVQLYLSGGAVRDLLRGRTAPHDIDITIAGGARAFLAQVHSRLGRGALVDLGEEQDDTCRLALPEVDIDVSGFRGGASTIEADLGKRDFTINAMAMAMEALLPATLLRENLIDPLGGYDDLHAGIVRACPGAFVDDPLRLLRAYRFSATLGFAIEAHTRTEIVKYASLIRRSAAERVGSELDLIMASGRAGAALAELADTPLFAYLLPELAAGEAVSQPPFHHLDVLSHCIETVCNAELIMAAPRRYFQRHGSAMEEWLADADNRLALVWAAFLHDIGKPFVKKGGTDGEPITFYNHDEHGASLVVRCGSRLRWSNQLRDRVAALVRMHMHPFHLLAVQAKKGTISKRAALRLCRRAGAELSGLFMVALADCMAGRGPARPEGLEDSLVKLYADLIQLYQQQVKPTLARPRLLTGHDLIDTIGLKPGPLFTELLDKAELATLEGIITTRREALDWVRGELNKDNGQSG
jgi:poly(A) polymerase